MYGRPVVAIYTLQYGNEKTKLYDVKIVDLILVRTGYNYLGWVKTI